MTTEYTNEQKLEIAWEFVTQGLITYDDWQTIKEHYEPIVTRPALRIPTYGEAVKETLTWIYGNDYIPPNDKEKRRENILSRRAAGETLKEIAMTEGVTVQRIHQIIHQLRGMK